MITQAITQAEWKTPRTGDPWFFPSISSVKTNYSVFQYAALLNSMGAERYLVSAYDLARIADAERDAVLDALREADARGCVVLLDSGNYESYWKADRSWSQRDFHAVARDTACSLVFSFDNQELGDRADAIVPKVVEGVLRDTAALGGRPVCPIIHGAPAVLPQVCVEVAQRLGPPMIAVPERELGSGIYERAANVRRIRDGLSSVRPSPRLHLLGTGNPLSLLVFAACGAESFDGLEWCQTCADHTTGRLYHFQHYDFFSYQTPLGTTSDLSFPSAVLSHNLLFFSEWMAQISGALDQGRLRQLLADYLPSGALGEFEARVAGAFS